MAMDLEQSAIERLRMASDMSIRPEWCQKIMAGQKTIEVRKTRPKMETPFRCYIYQTGKGGVIGEFVCDEITSIDGAERISSDIARHACLEPAEIHKYLGAAEGYGWHISDLRIYDAPKALSEFWAERLWNRGHNRCVCFGCWDYEKRAPQSWQYVEEMP